MPCVIILILEEIHPNMLTKILLGIICINVKDVAIAHKRLKHREPIANSMLPLGKSETSADGNRDNDKTRILLLHLAYLKTVKHLSLEFRNSHQKLYTNQ